MPKKGELLRINPLSIQTAIDLLMSLPYFVLSVPLIMLLNTFPIIVGYTNSSAVIRLLGTETTYLNPLVTDTIRKLRTANSLMFMNGTLLILGS
jgi:hypothetical protein